MSMMPCSAFSFLKRRPEWLLITGSPCSPLIDFSPASTITRSRSVTLITVPRTVRANSNSVCVVLYSASITRYEPA